MSRTPPIETIGLTGGIATGKSTAARMFAELGVAVVDADEVARDVVRPGTATLSAIEAAFGPDILDRDGSLNRQALAARVFSDAAERETLNAIIHPAIAARSLERLAQAKAKTSLPYVIYEAPLLYENKLEQSMAGVIVVYAPRELQRRRLRRRDALSEAQADQRLAAQMPIEEKRSRATWVIRNTTDLEALRSQVIDVHAKILAKLNPTP